MIHYRNIQDFLRQESIAVVGVSRSEKKFGNTVYKELKKKGYRVFAVHPSMTTIDGEPCYADLASLPEKVGGLFVNVQPSKSIAIVREAARLGIRHIWLQQGAQSEEVVNYCNENGINVVYGECLLMYAEPVESFHRFHRFIWRILGKIPSTTNGHEIPLRQT